MNLCGLSPLAVFKTAPFGHLGTAPNKAGRPHIIQESLPAAPQPQICFPSPHALLEAGRPKVFQGDAFVFPPRSCARDQRTTHDAEKGNRTRIKQNLDYRLPDVQRPIPFLLIFRFIFMQTERHMKPASQPVLGPYFAATRETVAAALSRAGPVLLRR